jgi:beta-lactamase regulating signal transducer with metallopeptidase domain
VSSTFMYPSLLLLAVKSLVPLSLAAFILILLRRSSPSVRHLVMVCSICSTLCLPLSLVLPEWSITNLPLVHQARMLRQSSAEDLPVDLERVSTQTTKIVFSRLSWTTWVMLFWFIGMLVLLIRLASGLVLAYRLAGRCRPGRGTLSVNCRRIQDKLGFKRQISILIGNQEGAPSVAMTMGIFRPVVLLPKEAETWTERRLHTTLLHEFAHIRRNDFIWQVLTQLVCAIYWFNPLVWFIAGRVYTEAELAADDSVVLAGVQPADYAKLLLEAVRALRPMGRTVVALAGRSRLEVRILSLVSAGRRRQPLTPRVLVLTMLVAIGLLIPLAAVQLVAQHDVSGTELKEPRNDVALVATTFAKFRATDHAALDLQKRHPINQHSVTTPFQPVRVSPTESREKEKLPPQRIVQGYALEATTEERVSKQPKVAVPAVSGAPAASPIPPQPATLARVAQ